MERTEAPLPTAGSGVPGVNPRLAKRPLVYNGRSANRELTSLVKEATGVLSGSQISETHLKIEHL